jgi:SAM-dependent methyltransferase
LIKSAIKKLIVALGVVGIDLLKIAGLVRGFPGYVSDYFKIKSQVSGNAFPIRFYPILADKYKQGGTAKGHYFHQDLLVARKIFQADPEKHVDVGSRVDGFIAHVATFRKIFVIDIRDLTSQVDNIEFLRADMMNMNSDMSECCDSLSCLHALEHFGLGRYGDPIDFNGHLSGFDGLIKLLKPGGVLYFSVPIGHQRIEFNAHRVFSVQYLLDMFGDRVSVEGFSYVDDRGDLKQDVALESDGLRQDFGCNFGCGIFELRKK